MAMVDAIVTSLVNNVSQLLVQETNLVLNAKDQVESLHAELNFINAFLRRHSEGKRDEVREEVKQIHDVALEAEDLLDDFVIKMAQYKRRNWLQRFFHAREKIVLLRNVAVEVKRINRKLKKIHENKDKYNIPNNEDIASERVLIQRRRRDVEEDEVVSFDNDVELVIKMLDTQGSRRDVVSIVGMGGLGKTTLAKKIYNSSVVKGKFDCRAWVDVSQDYNSKELLLKIVKSVLPSMKMEEADMLKEMVEADKLTEDNLVEKLKKDLEEKRYMIVLDDVWDKHLWDGIKAAFPDNSKRSRVLITSRLNEVASHASVHILPHFLPFLNDDDSWKLFSKKVFHDEVCPPKREQLARQQILPKCKGLPLAIVVVAGLLRNRDESMWSKVASGLNWFLEEDPKDCLGILALSYDDLPPHLKPCFLYFGVYPEDFDIPVRSLIRLWVAEGFVYEETNNSLDMEDMAEEYLLQLIDRNLIQVGSRRSDGGVKTCRIHDLLRDLAISEAKKEKFLVVDTKVDGSSLASDTPIRRLSVLNGSRDIRLSVTEFSRLRSLFSFGDKGMKVPRCLEFPEARREREAQRERDKDTFSGLSKFCPYMRVLDIGSGKFYKFPTKGEKLVQLRYLRMNALSFDELPAISKLENLQTLDLDFEVARFDFTFRNLWEMQQLRHLLMRIGLRSFSIPKGNGNTVLPNIRTLSSIHIRIKDDVNMLKTFPNLKKLKVACYSYTIEIFKYLSKLHRLQTLNIRGPFKFTEVGALPLSLTKITLGGSRLDTSAFGKLGGLPNLQILKLQEGFLYDSKIIEYDCNHGQFPRLEVLHFRELDIERWSMEGQGLQSLVYLSIVNCDELKAIPDQLKQISTLRQLKVIGDCHDDLKESLKQIWVNDQRLQLG